MIHPSHIKRQLANPIGGRVFSTPYHRAGRLINQCKGGLVDFRPNLPRTTGGLFSGGDIQFQLCAQHFLRQLTLRIFKSDIRDLHWATHGNIAVVVPLQLQWLRVGQCARLQGRGSQPIGAIHQGGQKRVLQFGRLQDPYTFPLERIKFSSAAHLTDTLLRTIRIKGLQFHMAHIPVKAPSLRPMQGGIQFTESTVNPLGPLGNMPLGNRHTAPQHRAIARFMVHGQVGI